MDVGSGGWLASGDVGGAAAATPKTHSWFGIWARGPLGEREGEGRTNSGTYDKLVAAAAAAAEIAFTVDHSATLCRSPHSGSTY